MQTLQTHLYHFFYVCVSLYEFKNMLFNYIFIQGISLQLEEKFWIKILIQAQIFEVGGHSNKTVGF